MEKSDRQGFETVAAYIARLNRNLSQVSGRVRGEVSSVNDSYEKTIYFKIKDAKEGAILDCIIFRWEYNPNGIKLKEGDEIIVTGTPNLFAPSGKFSFKAETIEYAGEGSLKRDYERLKAELQAEGVFAKEKKRALPAFPKKIGIITSMRGVVIQDFNTNIGKHGFRLKAIDSRVEGKDAIHDLLAAIRAMAVQDIDVLVIIRGGGSLESMQAFNTESVVRAVASFKVPVITGIGHDTDVTLTQLAADIPCSTPTAVAEELNTPWNGLTDRLLKLEKNILDSYRGALANRRNRIIMSGQNILRSYQKVLSARNLELQRGTKDIVNSYRRIADRVRQANSLALKSVGIMRNNLRQVKLEVNEFGPSIIGKMSRVVDDKREKIKTANSIFKLERISIRKAASDIASLERSVRSANPENTLRLGYSITYVNGKIARSIREFSPGQSISTHLADGIIVSQIKEIKR